MLTHAMLLGCGPAPFSLVDPADEPAEDVLLSEPLELELRRPIDASAAQVIWHVWGTEVGLVPGAAPPGRHPFETFDLTTLGQPVRARVEAADDRTLVVTPLQRLPPGRVQEVRVVGLVQDGEEGEVTLRFRTRPNPEVAYFDPPSQGAELCSVDERLRYVSCTYGRADPGEARLPTLDDLVVTEGQRTYTYDEERLVEVLTSDRSRDTFTWGPRELPVVWQSASRPSDGGPDDYVAFVGQTLELDGAGHVVEARLEEATSAGGLPDGDPDWRSLRWELDAWGRATRWSRWRGQAGDPVGRPEIAEELVYDERGWWTGGRRILPGSDGRLDTGDDQRIDVVNVFDDDGRLVATEGGSGPETVAGWRYELDESGSVIRELPIVAPDTRYVDWFENVVDVDGQRLERVWHDAGPDRVPQTDDDFVKRITTYEP